MKDASAQGLFAPVESTAATRQKMVPVGRLLDGVARVEVVEAL